MRHVACRRGAPRRGRLAAALAATILAVPVVAPPAGAQETIGSAKAIAIVVKVAPAVGALELALGSGIAVSDVRNQVAQAQTQAVDLGLIGSTLTGEGCTGGDPTFRPEDLPQALRVDNREGDARAESTEVPLVPGTLDGISQVVRATKQPLSDAQTTAAKVSLGEMLQVDGGKATTTTEFRDGGATRIANATVTVDIVIPNVLSITGLRWEAMHATGKQKAASARFSIGGLKVLGQTIPFDQADPTPAFKTINTLLNPVGITVTQPVVERVTTPTDFVRVTPLNLVYSGTPLQAQLLAPFLDLTRTLRDDLAAFGVDAACQLATAFLLAEVGLGQVAGTGSTRISIGGAEATTGSEIVENPFGDGGLLPPPPPATTPPPLDAGVTPLAPPASDVALPPAAPPAPEIATEEIGSFERVCQSVHPFRWPACSAGAGPFVGLGALIATAGIIAWDWRYQRRRRTPGDVEVPA